MSALPITPPYTAQRQNNMPSFGDQLDMIWHDINNGFFGEDAKNGSWFLMIQAMKEQFPKPI